MPRHCANCHSFLSDRSLHPTCLRCLLMPDNDRTPARPDRDETPDFSPREPEAAPVSPKGRRLRRVVRIVLWIYTRAAQAEQILNLGERLYPPD